MPVSRWRGGRRLPYFLGCPECKVKVPALLGTKPIGKE
jgi:hypothetical protein